MKLKEVAFLAARALALYTFIEGVRYLCNMIQFTVPALLESVQNIPGIREIIYASVLPGVLLIAFGICLWLLSDKAAGFMLGGRGETIRSPELKSGDLYVWGIAIMARIRENNA